MAFTVVFRPQARSDVQNIVDWMVSNGMRAAAARWRTGLLTTVASNLETDPHRYSLADEATILGINLRYLLYGRRRQVYRVLFVIEGQTVNILRVRNAAQDFLASDEV